MPVDVIHVPLMYDFTSAGASTTSVSSLGTVSDRRRAFRPAGVRGEIACYKFPALVQFQVFGPVSSSDNVWSTPVMAISPGQLRRFSHRIPASATSWFPSDANQATVVCSLVNICTNKGTQAGLKGTVHLQLDLRPFEPDTSCPALQSVVYDAPEEPEIM